MRRLFCISLFFLFLTGLYAQVYQGLQVPFNLGRFGNVSPITQASGLALDPNGTSFWTHNDQGNPTTKLYKFLPTSGNQMVTIQKEVNILNVLNLDWEDLAQDTSGNIYVCQIGKNCNENSDPNECPNRFVFKIHKVPLATLNHPDSANVTPQTYYFKYPLTGYDNNNCHPTDTVFANSESAIWYNGAIYIFTKNIWSKPTNNCGGWVEGYTYYFKVNLTEGSTMEIPIVAIYKGKFNLKPNPNDVAAKYQATAAAISPDHSTLSMTTYGRLWLFRHFTGDAFFNGTSMYVDYSLTGADTITRGYEGIEFKNDHYLDLCVDGLNGRVSGILVDSIALWIKQNGNAGPGSLRNAALCANAGDTLKFKPALYNDTIQLTTGPVIFNEDARIIQNSGQHIAIHALTSSVFNIPVNRSISLKNISLLSNATLESALINHGTLWLNDVTVDQFNNSIPCVTNTGVLQLNGMCKFN